MSPSDPGGAGATQDEPSPAERVSRQLTEPGRFAYAAVCAVSMGQLFGGAEHR